MSHPPQLWDASIPRQCCWTLNSAIHVILWHISALQVVSPSGVQVRHCTLSNLHGLPMLSMAQRSSRLSFQLPLQVTIPAPSQYSHLSSRNLFWPSSRDQAHVCLESFRLFGVTHLSLCLKSLVVALSAMHPSHLFSLPLALLYSVRSSLFMC